MTVRDIESSATWYQRVFRAQRVPMTFHTNTGNNGVAFDEAQTGLDHVGFNVAGREELEAWTVWLDELGVEHSGIRTGSEPFPFATVVFRDPDNIQLELFAAL